MKKLFTLITLITIVLSSRAQVRGFGSIDTADLRSTSCDYEKDANAEVLFDRAKVLFTMTGELALERHKRIKIFNEKGKENGNVRLEYDNMYGIDHIIDIEAQTFNLENGQIVITKVDPKQIYPEHTDKNKDAIVISFPGIKPGCVIEFRYRLIRNMAVNFPAWYFQTGIPTRYSEFDVYFDQRLGFKALTRVVQPFDRDTSIAGGHVWAATNLPASREESYMRANGDGLQSVSLLLTSIQAYDGSMIQLSEDWVSAGKKFFAEKEYFKELDQKLSGEDTLIKKALALKTDDQKIAYIFNSVKSTISWNGYKNWGSKDGIKAAWKKRVGNSAEVNAVLCHLLKKSGIKAYPMLVSTRENGQIQPDFFDRFQLNNLVAYIPVDTGKYYVLDATDRYNTYNQVPFELLNSYGLYLDRDNGKDEMVYIKTSAPSREIIIINGEIGADAKMKGTGQLSSVGYARTHEIELYKTLASQQFNQYLTGNDNNIKISDLKLENMQVDTLPLQQAFNFTYELNNSDNYIFFTPNIFTPLHNNPFISEARNSEVDFGFGNDHVIVGTYKIPAGYNIESLPKSTNMTMPDKSIRFRRLLEKNDGYISLHYEINIKRTRFQRSEYADLREFYKKMYEMMNEQIVLKKP